MRVAQASHDALAAFHALTAVGMLHLSRAEPREAVPYFVEALTTAERGNLRQWIAPSMHSLFIAHRDAGDSERGRTFAWRAMALYDDRRDGHRLCLLAADIEESRLSCLRTEEQAWSTLATWKGAFYNTETARERMIARANRMSAASLIFRRAAHLFWRAADAFQASLDECAASGEREDLARCLVEAAVASCRVGDFPRAARVAGHAITFALARGEGIVAQAAGEARMAALAERAPLPLWD